MRNEWFQKLASALRCDDTNCRCQRSGKRWAVGHCPAHNGHRASLGLKKYGNALAIECRAGCGPDAVEAALRQSGHWPQSIRSASNLDLLLQEVSEFVKRFVVFRSQHQVVAVALWILHTHAVDAANATPYLGITAPEKRSGKSRLLEVLELIVARPWRAILPSEAVLFRKIDQDKPTLLLDEVDVIFGDKSGRYESIRAMLNSGHRRGGTVPRCLDSGNQVRDFVVFGPKAITGIGDLPDTVADRSIPIRLARRAHDEHIEPFRCREVTPKAEYLRRRLESWAESAEETLEAARPEMPGSLNDRACDGWEPLLAIADAAGGDWPRLAREAAVALHGDSREQDESLGITLLRAIHEVFEKVSKDRIPTAHLLRTLADRDDGPWAEWWGDQIRSGNDRGPASRLARLLRRYEITSKPIRTQDGMVKKGYSRADFEEAFRRYLPSPPE